MKKICLTPPEIKIAKYLVGTRPMRKNAFNISKSVHDSKQVIHCYGHGGAGWTTLFGSVAKAIELCTEKTKPIRVIGAGCIGLTMAIELARSGFNVAGITTTTLYENASWVAACYFGLVSVATCKKEQEKLRNISFETFKTYSSILEGHHPYIVKESVRYLPVYCSQDTESGVEDLAKQGLIPAPKEVDLDFGGGVLHENYLQYMTYFMDAFPLMQQLISEVQRLKIPIEFKTLNSFNEVKEELIFNCSGMGAKFLCQDNEMVAVRGHLLLLKEPCNKSVMNYMVYTKFKGETVYLFPKSPYAVVGGTFIQESDRFSEKELEVIDNQEFTNLLRRNRLFFYGK